LSLAIALIFYSFKTVDFVTIFCLVPSIFQEDFLILGYKVSKITLITCFLFLGAVGKSAQIGLHT
jgi:NADH:ubiquinone oxidoreductase subunit 5 (subunit L)/multisubunit Na+/H+ antiporter MnhA subunit